MDERPMLHDEIVGTIADILKSFDSEYPVHKTFKPGIGPYGEPQLVREIASRLTGQGIHSRTHQSPDMSVQGLWAFEFKIVRPFGDNGRQAESWSQNLLHPYEGNVSLIGDAMKLSRLDVYPHKCLFVISYEHNPPIVDIEPLLSSFELISRYVRDIPLGKRIEEKRDGLVHPVHQVMRCFSWELDVQRPLRTSDDS